MAKERATILAHELDIDRIDLTPVRDHRSRVEAPSEIFTSSPLPGRPASISMPAGFESNDTILDGFASLRPAEKRERMVPYPIRLPTAQIAELERLKLERGIIPAEFIRDAVASCLALLRREL